MALLAVRYSGQPIPRSSTIRMQIGQKPWTNASPAVGDRLAQRAAHHDGAPAVAVAEAAGEGLERQPHRERCRP